MVPIALNPQFLRIGVAGTGALADRRAGSLAASGAAPVRFATAPDDAALDGLNILYVVGLPADGAKALAARARARRVLVNVEDVPDLCDFHSVAELRRGDLLLTVSTNGAAPGLAGTIRRHLETCFGPEWAGHVSEIAAARATWQRAGIGMAEAAQRIDAIVAERCWLASPSQAA